VVTLDEKTKEMPFLRRQSITRAGTRIVGHRSWLGDDECLEAIQHAIPAL
jgi:hypothetical protein